MINPAALRSRFTLVPDRVTVGYRPQTALGTYATATDVPDSWWRPGVSAELAPSFGVATRSLRTWYIPKVRFTTALAGDPPTPAVGDLLVSPVTDIDPVSATWTVTAINDAGALGAWTLETVSLQLASNLRGTITVTRPDGARDASGRPAPSYTTLASAVPARVQPQGGTAGEVFDRVTMPKRYTCYAGAFVDVRAKDRVTDGEGVVYTVVGSRNPERLDALFEIDLERVL